MSTPDLTSSSSLAVFLFRDVLSRVSHLKREARTLSDYEYRSSTPPRVAKLIYAIVDQCEQEVRAEWDEYQRAPTDPDRETILNSVQTWDSLLRATGGRLRYIIGASASRVPSGLGRLLETIIQELKLGNGILLREKWSYNYSIDFTPIEKGYYDRLDGSISAQMLSTIFGDERELPRTYEIGFPAIERDNTLLHCAIAHELGHIPVESWLTQNYDADRGVANESREAAQRLLGDIESEQEEFELYSEIIATTGRIQNARRRFLQEYGSDIFAIELFGPAALLAMTNIAMSHGLDSEPTIQKDYYPSWRSRLRFALDWLRRETADSWLERTRSPNEWEKSLKAHLAQLDLLLGQVRAPRNLEMAEADGLAKKTLQSLGPHLVDQIPYPRKVSMDQAYILADRLKTLTPPNDIGADQRKPQPPLLSAILNAGWLYTIQESERTGHVLDDGDSKDIVNRLLLKALSDVIIMRGYQKHLEGLEAS